MPITATSTSSVVWMYGRRMKVRGPLNRGDVVRIDRAVSASAAAIVPGRWSWDSNGTAAIVCGASSGMGLAIARGLAAEGCST